MLPWILFVQIQIWKKIFTINIRESASLFEPQVHLQQDCIFHTLQNFFKMWMLTAFISSPLGAIFQREMMTNQCVVVYIQYIKASFVFF